MFSENKKIRRDAEHLNFWLLEYLQVFLKAEKDILERIF